MEPRPISEYQTASELMRLVGIVPNVPIDSDKVNAFVGLFDDCKNEFDDYYMKICELKQILNLTQSDITIDPAIRNITLQNLFLLITELALMFFARFLDGTIQTFSYMSSFFIYQIYYETNPTADLLAEGDKGFSFFASKGLNAMQLGQLMNDYTKGQLDYYTNQNVLNIPQVMDQIDKKQTDYRNKQISYCCYMEICVALALRKIGFLTQEEIRKIKPILDECNKIDDPKLTAALARYIFQLKEKPLMENFNETLSLLTGSADANFLANVKSQIQIQIDNIK